MALTGNVPKEFTGALAWHQHGVEGAGVVVAVVDTGVYPHEDLTIIDGWAIDGEEPTNDANVYGHGTHVAGIAAGAVYGIAPGAQVLPIKITKGSANTTGGSSIIDGLKWLLDWRKQHPEKRLVVNISMSNTHYPSIVEEIDALVAADVPVVVAACNDGDEKSPIAEYDSPIVVANLKNDSKMSDNSSCWGALTDCCVIGSSVISCKNAGSGYRVLSGTSMASPAVAGMMALILSRWPEISEADAYAYLMDHATPAEVKCPSGLHLIPRVELPDDFGEDDGGNDEDDKKDPAPQEKKMISGVSEGNALIVRAKADTKSDKVGHLYNGDVVTVLDRDGDRALVGTGTCGWIKASYLTEPPDEPEQPADPDIPADWPETIEGVQQALTDWGFGAIVGEIDGKNGPKTKEAVKQFQAAMGLDADGIAGPKTWAALKSGIITPRLTEADMECQCNKYCDGYPNSSTAGVRLLVERIWREAEKKYPGLMIYVTCRAEPTRDGAIAGGQRCEQWNKERGGASGSQHKYGRAADIYGKCDGVKDAEIRDHLEELALEMNVSGGVGYGARYIVHVDVRGTKARWKY